MRNIKWWLTLTAALALGAPALVQPPELKKDGPQGVRRPAPITVDDIVDWIMSFDKDKKGKVTKDDLPERMQYLIEKGDTNKDGALDRDEVRTLAAKLQKEGFGVGGGVRTRRPGGGIGRPDGPPPDPLEGVVDDLKLSDKKTEQAKTALKAHQENVRKLTEQSRTEMLQKMKEILSTEEFEDFKAAMDRPRGQFFFEVGPRQAAGPGELERKLEQLQKEVEELRRQQKR